jgi:hypothetical protein
LPGETEKAMSPAPLIYFCFWWDWGLNSVLCTCKAGTLPLEPQL